MKATSEKKGNGISVARIHNGKYDPQFPQIQTTRWRAYQILAKKLSPKRAAIQVIFLRTMVEKATRTVIMLGSPRHQQAAGEERSLQIKNKKEKSALVTNRGGVLGLPKVKVRIRAMHPNKKARIEDHSVERKKQRRSPGTNWMISVKS